MTMTIVDEENTEATSVSRDVASQINPIIDITQKNGTLDNAASALSIMQDAFNGPGGADIAAGMGNFFILGTIRAALEFEANIKEESNNE